MLGWLINVVIVLVSMILYQGSVYCLWFNWIVSSASIYYIYLHTHHHIPSPTAVTAEVYGINRNPITALTKKQNHIAPYSPTISQASLYPNHLTSFHLPLGVVVSGVEGITCRVHGTRMIRAMVYHRYGWPIRYAQLVEFFLRRMQLWLWLGCVVVGVGGMIPVYT